MSVSWGGHRGCAFITTCVAALTAGDHRHGRIAGGACEERRHPHRRHRHCSDDRLQRLDVVHQRGAENQITALGSCWAVTTQGGSSNTVIADNVVNDITVYGWDQTVLYKSGEPFVLDRGRELGMTNRIDRVPA